MTIDVLLREVREDDLPEFFEQQRDPDAARMAAFPPRERDAFATHWAKVLADGSVVKKTILYCGKVVGHVVCFEQGDMLQIGYWIGKPYWGKGIATRALTGFLAEVQARPLHAYVAKHNVASLRVLQKCGFKIREDVKPMSPHIEGVEEILLELDGKIG